MHFHSAATATVPASDGSESPAFLTALLLQLFFSELWASCEEGAFSKDHGHCASSEGGRHASGNKIAVSPTRSRLLLPANNEEDSTAVRKAASTIFLSPEAFVLRPWLIIWLLLLAV